MPKKQPKSSSTASSSSSSPASRGKPDKGGAKGSKPAAATSEVPKSVQSTSSGVRLVVRVKPNSRSNSVEAVDDEAVSVHVAAEARDGKANAELVEFVAEALGVHRRDVTVDKGSRSHDKVVLVAGISAETALERLRRAAAE